MGFWAYLSAGTGEGGFCVGFGVLFHDGAHVALDSRALAGPYPQTNSHGCELVQVKLNGFQQCKRRSLR